MNFFDKVAAWFNEEIILQIEKTFIRENRWKVFLEGLQNTLVITIIAALIGIAIGVVVALTRYVAASSRAKKKHNLGSYILFAVDRVLGAYIAIMRGTPLAIQLMIMAFIIFAGFPNKIVVCCVAFGVNSGAYVAEVIRGGIASVDIGQMEAGRSLGLSQVATLRMIILPQAVKSILPALCNEAIAVLKETSILGLIAVTDLTRASELVRSRTYEPFFPLVSVAIVYFILVAGLSAAVKRLERRLAKSDRH